MKLPLLFILTSPSLYAGMSFTEDFMGNPDDPNDLGAFQSLSNSTVASVNNGTLEFDSPSGQGAAVGTSDLGAALGTSLSDIFFDNNAFTDDSLFLEFTTATPGDSGAAEELGFFLGNPSASPASGNITQGGTRNGFTVFFNDGDLIVNNNNNNSNTQVTLFNDLGIGSEVTISVELSLAQVGQNANDIGFLYTLTAVTEQGEFTGDFNGAAQNINANFVDNFEFVASTTEDIAGSLSSFTISDKPIVPEPSTALLTLLALPVLLRRRRHA